MATAGAERRNEGEWVSGPIQSVVGGGRAGRAAAVSFGRVWEHPSCIPANAKQRGAGAAGGGGYLGKRPASVRACERELARERRHDPTLLNLGGRHPRALLPARRGSSGLRAAIARRASTAGRG